MAARNAQGAALAQALADSRRDTLAGFAALQAALGPVPAVPYRPSLNPPLWELGHVGWFQERWIARNPQRHRGADADPDAALRPARRGNADALYDSSRVPHVERWQLPLPDAEATRADLAAQLEATLQALPAAGDDRSLYFHRLVLFHEDMHHEAALYMARGLDVATSDARWQPPVLPPARLALPLAALAQPMGSAGPGFAFDNEVPPCTQRSEPARIDSRVLNWAEYLGFAEDGGYSRAAHWTAAGWAWLQRSGLRWPLYLRREGGTWLQRRGGQWRVLDLAQPAEHLSLHEAQAWCRWAGRCLPTESQWQQAADGAGPDAPFHWGAVWEWTATAFGPWPGFKAHPYRDYSQPWFDGRPVLRGASYLTQPRMRHRRYRNFFGADRNDVAAGFRSCVPMA